MAHCGRHLRLDPLLVTILLSCALHASAATASVAVVNAATYVSQIAPGSIASAFGTSLPFDSATSVNVCSTPSNCLPAAISAASASQINFLVPSFATANPLLVQVLHSGTVAASGSVRSTNMSPGIFTANNSGSGIFNGQAYDQNLYDPIFTLGPNGSIVPKPVSAVSGGSPNILILYGTGFRATGAFKSVQVTVGGIAVTPNYAGGTVAAGLDQMNITIPAGLAGVNAQLVNVTIAFTGAPASTTGVFAANTVQFCLAGSNPASSCPLPGPAPAATCNQPIPGVAAPYAPHGLFLLEFPGQSVTPSVLKTIMNESTVCGGNIFVIWSEIDSGNGQYNWTTLDSDIAAWTAIGKSVNLIVWGISDSSPNSATPSYVLNDPTLQTVSCADEGTSTVYTYPVPYSAGYQNNYKPFISAVLNRYGSNPSVGYIRFGLSRGGEVFPTCLTQMMTLGGYSTIAQFDTEWESYLTEMTAYQKTIQSSILNSAGFVVQLMAALNQYGTPVQYNVTSFEAQNAATLGFGFGSQGLQLSDIGNYNAGQPCSSDWCSNFVLFAGQVPLELQTIAASDPTNAAAGTGSMTVLLPFALSLRTQIFEVYLQDFQVAYDPSSVNYAMYSQAYQQAFQSTAAIVGGR